MSDTVDALILDLLEWVGSGLRPYHEVMDAWRTSCPRLTVWEDAVDRGLVAQVRDARGAMSVCATGAGIRLLRESGRSVPS